ncbi:MAG: ABC transporter permease [Vicinamibacterales bacterium]
MALDTFAGDLRFALRTLRREWTFALFATLVTGLGIGASTTVFSVAHALLLRPLPFERPEQLVWIANHDTPGLSGQTTQVDHMLDLREGASSLESLAGYFAFYGVGDSLMTGRGEPERLSGVPVSARFFDVLGVRPALGRTFTTEEGQWGGPRAVLLSHAFWERRFASDPGVVGLPLTLNDERYAVVGVLPESFDFASVFAPGGRFDVFFAFPLSPETNRWGNTMAMVGRLKPGVTAAAAQAEIEVLGAQFTADHPDRNSFEGRVRPLAEQVSGRLRPALFALVGAVIAVMLIVCANLSNLLLARAAARHREVAVRSAMGAGTGRLVAQMLTEGLVLSGLGALLGIGLAVVGTRTLASLDGLSLPLLRTVQVDGIALAFALGLTALTGVVFGLAPALSMQASRLHEALKDGTRGSTEGRGRRAARDVLVVSEIALACVLVAAAGLLIRSFVHVLDVDLGFQPARAATIRVDPDASYRTPDERNAYVDELLRRVREVPGVDAAGISNALPLGRNRTWGARARGKTYERGRAPSAYIRVVSDGYVEAMGIPLRAGRDLSDRDTSSSDPVVMVNESMARALWPGEDPVGQVILNACGADRRVVGVVGDVRHLALEQSAGNEMYLPMRQCGDQSSSDLVVRSALPPGQLANAVRDALRPIAPSLPGGEFRDLQSLVDRSVSPRRFLVLLLGGFAAFALLLAALGIFAVVSYSVSRRSQEIGIRMALGASAGHVRGEIVARTLRLALAGMACGMLGAWILSRAMQGLLFGVTSTDPATFVATLVLIAGTALLAGYLPARRASRIDPLASLRAD